MRARSTTLVVSVLLCAVALSLLSCGGSESSGPSLAKAEALHEYGLVADAKRELVGLVSSDAIASSEKAEAYYLLGSIAFEEADLSTALQAWQTLVSEYPSASPTQLVQDRLAELSQITGAQTKQTVSNAVALSYLRHAEFWSEGKDEIFHIDTSWIPNVESAVKWYDKVIQEFPGTQAAELAYVGKLRTLLGWKDSGRYGQSHGAVGDFDKYMPLVVATFSDFKSAFPEASTLQGFRFQIAQAYWRDRDWKRSRQWLEGIVEASGSSDSFYRDLAERRLNKLEY